MRRPVAKKSPAAKAPKKAKPAAKAQPAKADPEALNGKPLPHAGTKRRVMLDMLRRKTGATQAEIVAAGGIDESLNSYLTDWSAKYGLTGSKASEGKSTRYYLAG